MAAHNFNSSKLDSRDLNNYCNDETLMIYKQIKWNLHSIQNLANEVNVKMQKVKQNMIITKKILDVIQSTNNEQ
ncbi:hypothetical protein PV328_004556 [Microctonus aethiopoides]|uniref:Uncharacterized protein n=1 Tax=Microctonus aethiopoides TaxID=144406 RepID=A0AA39FAR6_9HYME|nr:hypothetical protein PV328_004556 [Microctonus aethiopoides]